MITMEPINLPTGLYQLQEGAMVYSEPDDILHFITSEQCIKLLKVKETYPEAFNDALEELLRSKIDKPMRIKNPLKLY